MATGTPRYFVLEEATPTSSQLVEAVSSVAETEPAALPALQTALDPDAIDAVAQRGSTLAVSYGGYHVTILNGDRLVVREPDSLHARLGTAANVLVSTTDRDRSCHELLATYPPAWENVLSVSYDGPTVHLDSQPAETGFVIVGGFTRSGAQSSTATDTPSGVPSVTSVPDPTDLSSLGTAIYDQVVAWRANENQTVVCFHSVTDLLTHVDSADALTFLDRLGNALSAAGVLAHYHVDPEQCSAAELARLESIVDVTVERTKAGVRLSRSEGDDPAETT